MSVTYSSDEFSSENEAEVPPKEIDEGYQSDEPHVNDKEGKDAKTVALSPVKKMKVANEGEKLVNAMDSDGESSNDDMKKVKRGKELASKVVSRADNKSHDLGAKHGALVSKPKIVTKSPGSGKGILSKSKNKNDNREIREKKLKELHDAKEGSRENVERVCYTMVKEFFDKEVEKGTLNHFQDAATAIKNIHERQGISSRKRDFDCFMDCMGKMKELIEHMKSEGIPDAYKGLHGSSHESFHVRAAPQKKMKTKEGNEEDDDNL